MAAQLENREEAESAAKVPAATPSTQLSPGQNAQIPPQIQTSAPLTPPPIRSTTGQQQANSALLNQQQQIIQPNSNQQLQQQQQAAIPAAKNTAFTPPPKPVATRKIRDSFTADQVRRRRLNEYEKSLRRESNELEEDLFETENYDLIERQVRGRKRKAALPKRERKDRKLIFDGTWRKRYGVHERTKQRLAKYKTSLADIARSVARAFSGKRGGNKQG